MLVANQDLQQLTETIWETVVGLAVSREPPSTRVIDEENMLTGSVQISGGWEGAVLLHCPAALLREAAARLFGFNPVDITAEQLRDTLGELTNITGGNVKALLPGPSFLGLPEVADGATNGRAGFASRPVLASAFQSQGLPFTVTILERLPACTSEDAF